MTGKKFITVLFALPVFVSLAFLLPHVVGAQIIINEIQYNPEGTDGGYEWIELYNSGEQSRSIKNYTLRESDQNHKIKHIDENLGWIIPNDGYAIIADNPTKFLEKHPGFPGLLFDSSFTLLNSGELLEILDPNGELAFGFMYNPEWGGDGDGSTLGIVDSSWKATNKTPGYANSILQMEPLANDLEATTQVKQEVDQVVTSDKHTEKIISDIPATYIQLKDPEYKEKTIKSDAGPDRTLLASVPFLFQGVGYGLTGGILSEPTYTWNFGDGTREHKNKTLHTYQSPGKYLGTLKITSGKYSHTDHFIITVIPPELTLTGSSTAQTTSIQNQSPHSIELSTFVLETKGSSFEFPEGSFIGPQSKITLHSDSIELTISDAHKISLLAPNKQEIASYYGIVERLKEQTSLRGQEVSEKESIEKFESINIKESVDPQIVYVGVPQYIEQEITSALIGSTPQKINTENLKTDQSAQISNIIRREILSPFELLLLVGILSAAGFLGLTKLRSLKEEKSDQISIEIEEL